MPGELQRSKLIDFNLKSLSLKLCQNFKTFLQNTSTTFFCCIFCYKRALKARCWLFLVPYEF